MLKSITNFAFLLVIVGMVACGSGNKENTNKETKTSTASGETADNTEGSGDNTATAGDAASCTETKLEFTGEGLEVKDFMVAYAKINATQMQSKGQKYPAVFIVLANYGKGKSFLSRPKEKGQIKLTMSFNGKSGTTVGVRKYDASLKGFGADDNFSANFDSSEKSYRFNKPTGVSEITYFGEDKICGTIDIKNAKGTTLLKGTFSVNRK
ncbi:MAG TPA: hypothetical protein DCS93_39545 [Microscillaceae bacterium]|nr:hypothetical protein [Microscillaceae bacterium]